MTDHAAAALEQLALTSPHANRGLTERQIAAAAAQAYATLALAEAVARLAPQELHRMPVATGANPRPVDDPTHAPRAVHALDPGTGLCRVHGNPWPCRVYREDQVDV